MDWHQKKEIWRKKTEEGMTLRALAEEYGVSAERIRQIVIKMDRIYNPDSKTGSTLRDRFMDEFKYLVEGRGQTSMSIQGIFNAVLRRLPIPSRLYDPEEFLNSFMECSEADFLEMRGIGVERVVVLLDIQKAIQSTDGLRERLLNGCERIS